MTKDEIIEKANNQQSNFDLIVTEKNKVLNQLTELLE